MRLTSPQLIIWPHFINTRKIIRLTWETEFANYVPRVWYQHTILKDSHLLQRLLLLQIVWSLSVSPSLSLVSTERLFSEGFLYWDELYTSPSYPGYTTSLTYWQVNDDRVNLLSLMGYTLGYNLNFGKLEFWKNHFICLRDFTSHRVHAL